MWTVTRQSQWPDGNQVVEISAGDFDYCNPGMLVAKYAGEGETYSDPREAVKVAIEIAQAWQNDAPKKNILIAHGATGGGTMPFDGEELTEETFTALRTWAEEKYENLPKCDRCGDVLGKEKYRLSDYYDFTFCSDNCANMFLEAEAEFHRQEEVEDQEEEVED